MNKIPKVAVLMASYNGIKWIKEQIESVLNQADVEITLFISDDHSSDGTDDVVKNIASEDKRVILLSKIKAGSAAKNFYRLIHDIPLGDFDYFSLCDQDDIWHSNKLIAAILLMRNNKVDGYSSNVTVFWDNGQQKLINKSQTQTDFDFMFESPGPGCTYVLSKTLMSEVQDYLRKNRNNCSDVDFHDWFIYAFARSRGFKWHIDHVPSLMYRQHNNNVLGANIGFKPLLSRFRKLKTGWYYKQILLISNALAYQESWPIKRLKRLNVIDRLILAINTHRFRRSMRDKIALSFFILFLANK